MIFARIIYSALFAGIAAGVLLTSLQLANLQPIILAAERYENSTQAAPGQDRGDADHSQELAPAAGAGRIARTLVANLLAGTGFAAVLLALMCLSRLARGRYLSWSEGALWGLAGYAALFVAPAIGLPPEIPGIDAAPVEHRQLWWLLTALSAAIGLAIFAFAPARTKAVGILFLALPYIVGAPVGDGAEFAHSNPAVVGELVRLHQRFIVGSAIVNLVFWLVLGLVCRYAFNRWLRAVVPARDRKRD